MTKEEEVVGEFVGDYVSSGERDYGTAHKKRAWFPDAGVKLNIREVKRKDDAGTTIGAYAKCTVSDTHTNPEIAAAVYRVQGDTLVAVDLEVANGMLLKETLSWVVKPTTKERVMLHQLDFSDQTSGMWVCPDPKP